MNVMQNVEVIGIYHDKIIVSPKKGKETEFNRDDYELVLEKVERVRDISIAREHRTAVYFSEGMICRADEKTIYCGDNPETIWR